VQFVVTGEVFVLSFTEKEEQVFLNLSSNVTSHACFDPIPSLLIGQVTFAVIGGTGRFAGATGTIVKTFKTIGLAAAAPGRGIFLSFTGMFDGTIEFAK